MSRPARPTIRKDFRATTIEELKRELTDALSDVQRQLDAQGQILPHSVDGLQPKGLRKGDRLMGRGTRGNITGIADGRGGVASQEVPDSVTQYQDPQGGIVAPALVNYPKDGDFGWYRDTVGAVTYFTWNRSGTLYSLSDSITTLSGSITAAQHGVLTNNATARHSNVTTTVDGFMSAADKVILNGATTSTTGSTLVLRGSGGAINATSYNVSGTQVAGSRKTGYHNFSNILFARDISSIDFGGVVTASDANFRLLCRFVAAIAHDIGDSSNPGHGLLDCD